MICTRLFLSSATTQLKNISAIRTILTDQSQINKILHKPTFSVVLQKKKEKISNILLNFGFSDGQVQHIMNSPIDILEFRETDISTNLKHWLSFDANKKLLTVLTGNPEMLTFSPQYVNRRVKDLLTIFTKKDVNKLLITCPKAYIEDFDDVMEKVQYIVHLMKVEQDSIVKSCALQFDLDYIKCRHDFLCRAGIYRTYKKTKNKNAPLSKILSRNLKTYMKLTNLTEEEYEVFREVIDYEVYELEDLLDEDIE